MITFISTISALNPDLDHDSTAYPKSLNISVVELFGGPTREHVRLYWSHCGTYRARNYELCNTPPLESLKDIYNLGKEVIEKGSLPEHQDLARQRILFYLNPTRPPR